MTEDQKKALKARFKQAAEELDDESIFSPDQITKLRNAEQNYHAAIAVAALENVEAVYH